MSKPEKRTAPSEEKGKPKALKALTPGEKARRSLGAPGTGMVVPGVDKIVVQCVDRTTRPNIAKVKVIGRSIWSPFERKFATKVYAKSFETAEPDVDVSLPDAADRIEVAADENTGLFTFQDDKALKFKYVGSQQQYWLVLWFAFGDAGRFPHAFVLKGHPISFTTTGVADCPTP